MYIVYDIKRDIILYMRGVGDECARTEITEEPVRTATIRARPLRKNLNPGNPKSDFFSNIGEVKCHHGRDQTPLECCHVSKTTPLERQGQYLTIRPEERACHLDIVDSVCGIVNRAKSGEHRRILENVPGIQ